MAALRGLSLSALATLHHDGEVARFDSHPLIKGFFYDALSTHDRRRVHQLLLDLARGIPVGDNPTAIDEIQPLLDVFWHEAAIDDLEAAFATWSDKRVRNRLLWWGNYQVALDLVDRLLAAPAFRSRASPDIRGYLLDQSGMLLVKVGQPSSAIDSYQQAVNAFATNPPRQLQTLLHLCETQIEVGLFLAARDSLRQACRLAPTVPDFPQFRVLGRRGYLATALSPPHRAEALLSRAIHDAEQQEGSVPGYRCLFLRIRGDLRCANGQLDAAEADYRTALTLAVDPRWRFVDYEGHLRRGLGEVAAQRLRWAEATEHFGAALDVARRLGYRWLEAETFAALARGALRVGDLAEARENAARADALAAAGGWVAVQADSLLTCAECDAHAGHDTATLAAVRGLISRSGSRWLKARYRALSGEPLPTETSKPSAETYRPSGGSPVAARSSVGVGDLAEAAEGAP